MMYINGLHYNSKQWQRPNEFLPERFDPSSPLFLTPDGKKRNPFSFFPFSGGRRVCFGKTFAEANLKYISAFLTQYFDFEFVDSEKYKSKYPRAFTFMPAIPSIEVRVRSRGGQ